MLDIQSEEFKTYLHQIQKDEEKRHTFYKKSKNHARDLGVHIKGEFPEHLLDKVRPNEDEEIKKYRKESYEPETIGDSERVISVVQKIINNRLFRIDWEPKPNNAIKDSEWIDQYLTEDLPFHNNWENFIKKVYIKQMLSDPNGVCLIIPENIDSTDREFFKPIPVIYNSEDIFDFVDEKYFIIHTGESGGKHFYTIVDDTYYYRVIFDGDEIKDQAEPIEHNFGSPPAFRLGGQVAGANFPYYYKSFISGIIPYWNKVVNLSSDLDAAYVNHLYLEKWEKTTTCDKCHGNGRIKESSWIPGGQDDIWYQCQNCGGSGHSTSRSPYNFIEVNESGGFGSSGEKVIPPAGYIEKPVDIVKIVEETKEKKRDQGFEAINMDVINKVGEDQSGKAKVVDRTELDSFLKNISDHIYDYVLPQFFMYTMYWRYYKLIDVNAITLRLPEITKPVSFDMLSIQELTEELQTAKEGNMNPAYNRELTKDLISKRFHTSPERKKELTAIIDLNPFLGMSETAISDGVMAGYISKKEAYKSTHIEELVKQGISKDNDFLNKEFTEQKEIIDTKVDEIFEERDIKTPSPDGQPGGNIQ